MESSYTSFLPQVERTHDSQPTLLLKQAIRSHPTGKLLRENISVVDGAIAARHGIKAW